jgi:hypothetical protein
MNILINNGNFSNSKCPTSGYGREKLANHLPKTTIKLCKIITNDYFMALEISKKANNQLRNVCSLKAAGALCNSGD